MQALWHINESESVLKSQSNEGLKGLSLTSLYSMVSTGTERKVALGQISNSFIKRMYVPYMEGDFNLPIKYGYSLIAKDDNGNTYHLMHPHQSKVFVSPNHVHQLPDDLPPARAALISNMETIINAIWDSEPYADDKVAICGFGNIGALLAITLNDAFEINPTIIETKNWNKQKAASLGFGLQEDERYDIIYHTSGTAQGLQYCIDHLLPEGKVIELSWYGNQPITLNLGERFHYDRLQIISSQVSSIPFAYQDKHDYQSRKESAIELLSLPRFDKLITDYIPFQDAPQFFNDLRLGKQKEGLIYLIEY